MTSRLLCFYVEDSSPAFSVTGLNPSAESQRAQSWNMCHFISPPSGQWTLHKWFRAKYKSYWLLKELLPLAHAWRCAVAAFQLKGGRIGCPAGWTTGPSREINSVAKSKMSVTSIMALQLLDIEMESTLACMQISFIFFSQAKLCNLECPCQVLHFLVQLNGMYLHCQGFTRRPLSGTTVGRGVEGYACSLLSPNRTSWGQCSHITDLVCLRWHQKSQQKCRHVTPSPSQRGWTCFRVRNMIELSKGDWMACYEMPQVFCCSVTM